MIPFQNSFVSLPSFFFEPVAPLPLRAPKLLHTGPLRTELGLGTLSDESLVSWLNGESRLPGDQRISTRYAGHQFGVWAGQLGDGRTLSLGEILHPVLGRQEIQVKGSGPTPFSRRGDGKAVLRSSIREYLCAEAMHALGIPTTRSLAILSGEGLVEREELEPEALVARVFPSNIRFGHFEMAFHFQKKNELHALIEYVREFFYQGHSIEAMLHEVIDRTARMIALWQASGFCHGVMNTDNFSILGLTIDYGPFGFMEDFDPGFVCNHSDREGRYSYARQPQVAYWNLEKLLVCFTDVLPVETLRSLLNQYPELFHRHLLEAYQRKLGLLDPIPAQDLASLLSMLEETSLDYTFFFRELSRYEAKQPDSMDLLLRAYPEPEKQQALRAWLRRYDDLVLRESRSDGERTLSRMRVNPKWVLKNHIAQSVIESASRGDSAPLSEWAEVLRDPFSEHGRFEAESLPTPPRLKHLPVSCSS